MNAILNIYSNHIWHAKYVGLEIKTRRQYGKWRALDCRLTEFGFFSFKDPLIFIIILCHALIIVYLDITHLGEISLARI